MYKDLLKYYNDNEIYDYDETIRNDTYNDDLISDIENHFNDEEMLQDLSTGILKDMFSYYIKHHK